MTESKPPITILTYRGFGNVHRIYINGQISFSRHASVRRPRHGDRQSRLWVRLKEAMRLAISPRVQRARVRISCGGVTQEVETDSHGYFSSTLELPQQKFSPLWREYLVELLEPQSGEPVTGRGRVLSVTPHTQRVVVSDVDDTIIYTGVSNKLKMLWRLFFHGAADRVPFPGIAALYQAFYLGHNGEQQNPLIYLSRSPWSIYPILDEFFQLHDIPIGPVLQLRDWGISLLHPFPRRAKSYKSNMLHRVIEIYGELPLVLIGDSGQRDPELYTAFAREYPDQVAAIYIRDLRLSNKRTAELGAMQRAMDSLGIPLVVAANTEEIAKDAALRGWLSGSYLAEINQRAADGLP